MSPLLHMHMLCTCMCTCFAHACAAPTSLTPSQMHPEALRGRAQARLTFVAHRKSGWDAALKSCCARALLAEHLFYGSRLLSQNQQQAQQQQQQTQQQAKSLTKLTSVPCRGGSRPRRTKPNWPAPAEAKLCLGTGLPVHGSPPPHTAQHPRRARQPPADHSQVPTRRVA
jgi:hypothetical protein